MSLLARFPSLLRAETAEQYSVSIRLRVGGLAFVLYSRDTGELVYSDEYSLQSGFPSYKSAVEDLYFRYPFLSYPYHSVRVLYEPLVYTLVPADLYQEGSAALWLRPIADEYSVGRAEDWEVYTSELPDKQKLLVSAADKSLLQFLRRSMLVVEPEAFLSPFISEQGLLARKYGRKLLSMILRPTALDCLLFEEGELIFANSFPLSLSLTESAEELLYYVMLLWRNYNCSQSEDRLFIHPDEQALQATACRLEQLLEKFISKINLG
ncbi:DUF3822 family protein [Porphyromonas crevioricanis]|uniref:Protein of uncharacterized function (DUF3822) n=1 Tax=Porphyromonas crevioricanis TaxID=393921 RepID=A0A2X4Q0P7_9PORP|nr:DUF3822 family protein [Porphyromonas crevioricanis]KGN93913.1 hypothetical protein HQ38_07825 [Porphyromonas crevioricanis]GAD07641.1 hypothetical protein PORCAN_1265 [Porphyromonas crevioricanis JCM 13913]SQH73667.1 Protein of uncharacterised function (DUF3822) [Porphyromonas crevioricanis]